MLEPLCQGAALAVHACLHAVSCPTCPKVRARLWGTGSVCMVLVQLNMGVQACAADGQEATLDPRGGVARQQKQKKARLRAA